MKAISFKNIDSICLRLLASGQNGALVDKVLGDGIRQRIVDKDSLLLIIQRLTTTHQSWALALRTLESAQLDRHRISRDANIWRLIDKSIPENDAALRDVVQQKLRTIYGKKKPSGQTDGKRPIS